MILSSYCLITDIYLFLSFTHCTNIDFIDDCFLLQLRFIDEIIVYMPGVLCTVSSYQLTLVSEHYYHVYHITSEGASNRY